MASLLVNLHALLLSGDEVPLGSPEWIKAGETAESFKDAATGHDGRDLATWWAPVKKFAADAAAASAPSAAPSQTDEAHPLAVDALAASCEASAATEAAELCAAATPLQFPPTLSAAELAAIDDETLCDVTLSSLQDGDVLGFGLKLGKGGKGRCGGGGNDTSSCPCELLSARAFYKSNVRESSYRSPIDAFLPLYLSEAYFAAVKASGRWSRNCTW